MDWVPRLFGVIIQGSQTNWWGVGCPAHCFASGVPTIVLGLALGLSLGFILGGFSCLWVLGFLPPVHQSPSALDQTRQPSDRVRAYLNEPGALAKLRRRRD